MGRCVCRRRQGEQHEGLNGLSIHCCQEPGFLLTVLSRQDTCRDEHEEGEKHKPSSSTHQVLYLELTNSNICNTSQISFFQFLLLPFMQHTHLASYPGTLLCGGGKEPGINVRTCVRYRTVHSFLNRRNDEK